MAVCKITVFLVLLGAVANADWDCKNSQINIGAICYADECTQKIVAHIKEEFNAAAHYMLLATYFDQVSENKPGLAKFLYESASEERSHAILMLDYLNIRGIDYAEAVEIDDSKMLEDIRESVEKTHGISQNTIVDVEKSGEKTQDKPKNKVSEDIQNSGGKPQGKSKNKANARIKIKIADALKNALEKEIQVTQKIRDIIDGCSNDFHAADVFTTQIMDEQHDGIRKLQGAMYTLANMLHGTTADSKEEKLIEYLFDQKLLKNGLKDGIF